MMKNYWKKVNAIYVIKKCLGLQYKKIILTLFITYFEFKFLILIDIGIHQN